MHSEIMDNHTATILSAYATAAEENKQLTKEQLNILTDKKWFKIFVPENYGGLNFSLPEALRLEEALATIDGSLGWTFTLCAGANLFVGYINPEFAAQIFFDEKVCLGGSGAASGISEICDAGYLINGKWKYATGAPHLTHFTTNCHIHKNGQPVFNEDQSPMIRSFIFKKDEVDIIEDWNTMGLKATASHSFTVTNIVVNTDRCFEIHPSKAFLNNPIYHYPFLQLAETTLAVNHLGMALHFFETMKNMFHEKMEAGLISEERQALILKKIQKAESALATTKSAFYEIVDESWMQLCAKEKIDEAVLLVTSTVSKNMANQARTLVAELYPQCGIVATEEGTVLNRIFRDMFTASQHALFNI